MDGFGAGMLDLSDYTPLGLQKITQQAARDPTIIRCPRDSAVMRLLASRALVGRGEAAEGGEFGPAAEQQGLSALDLECPACRRRATGIPARRGGAARHVARSR